MKGQLAAMFYLSKTKPHKFKIEHNGSHVVLNEFREIFDFDGSYFSWRPLHIVYYVQTRDEE